MPSAPFFRRIFLIVMDSMGIGEMPDAARYNDVGAHTLGHIAQEMNGLHMPNMQRLGLGNIEKVQGIEAVATPKAAHGRMMEASAGKDTMTGHWEIMGVRVDTPFRVFTETGFPQELIRAFERKAGRKTVGNKAASGTEIIKELGAYHLQTGDVIVYTSADSVFQIAAHEEVVPLEELYRLCEIARDLTRNEPYMLGRVIARPFVGEPGNFTRTANRRDYALKPFAPTVMNYLQDSGYDVLALGKIADIYDGEGVTRAIKTTSNDDGMDKLLESFKQDFRGLSFLNLVDFDASFGHRRDPLGYGQALQDFDARLPQVLEGMQEEDLLIITADHGNDPTHHGTDHTREYVPLLAYSLRIREGIDLGVRQSFADVGATIADNFQVIRPEHGTSFLSKLS